MKNICLMTITDNQICDVCGNNSWQLTLAVDRRLFKSSEFTYRLFNYKPGFLKAKRPGRTSPEMFPAYYKAYICQRCILSK
jgi:hypothetical protein